MLELIAKSLIRVALFLVAGTGFIPFRSQAANTFTPTGALIAGRSYHTATLLPNGKVLVVGGDLASAELYDSATGNWTATGSPATSRDGNSATLLPNGRVLIAGGRGPFVFPPDGGPLNVNYPSAAEIYNPATGTWTSTGALATARESHTATLLANGKLLVVGGVNNGFVIASAELYDPVTGTWTSTGGLSTGRANHTATLLSNGKVVVAGGDTNSAPPASVELYDPTTGTWTATGSLAITRYNHTATLLPNGKILVAGGRGISGFNVSAELYDSTTGTWTSTGSLTTARESHTATLLANGKLLVAGGYNPNFGVTSAEIYDSATGTWSATGSLNTARHNHTATLLANGSVLVAGGSGITGGRSASSELYDSEIMNLLLIDYVTVGNVGNSADTSTENGAVDYLYKIAKYETTVRQYADFLNAVAATDNYGLYNPAMVTEGTTAGISRSGISGSYSYSVINGAANHPITWVSWFDAARFCNWLQNGQGNGNTETGAYTLSGATSGIFIKNAGAKIWIPCEKEWYKAAYYDPTPGAGGGDNYWLHANRSDLLVNNTVSANYFDGDFAVTQSASYSSNQNYLTDVGAYGAANESYYGTRDQGGSLREWYDALIFGSGPGTRGGSWKLPESNLRATYSNNMYPSNEFNDIGFRIASALTATEVWRYTWFGNTGNTGNTGDSADGADPDKDGLVNLLERAFNLKPNQPTLSILIADTGTTGLPLIRRTESPPVFSIQYLRRKASANPGLLYTPQFSSTLDGAWFAATGTETVESIDSEWERVTVQEESTGHGKRFGRVKVVSGD